MRGRANMHILASCKWNESVESFRASAWLSLGFASISTFNCLIETITVRVCVRCVDLLIFIHFSHCADELHAFARIERSRNITFAHSQIIELVRKCGSAPLEDRRMVHKLAFIFGCVSESFSLL